MNNNELAHPSKRPSEILDYEVDFGPELAMGEEINGHGASVIDGGITMNSFALTGTVIKMWITGGTPDRVAHYRAWVTTTGGRTISVDPAIPID